MDQLLQINQNMLLIFPVAGWMTAFAGVWIGLVIGSFLNVVITRIPIMVQRKIENEMADINGYEPAFTDTFNLARPGSKCMNCGHALSLKENLPVISFLLLAGRCKACGHQIPLRYFLVECAMAGMSGFFAFCFGLGFAGIATLLFLYMITVIATVDLEHMFFPHGFVTSLMWLGLVVNVYGFIVPIGEAVMGMIAGFLFLRVIDWIISSVFNRDAMGDGDCMLLAALGAWFGVMSVVDIAGISSLIAILFVSGTTVAHVIFSGKKPEGWTWLQFGNVTFTVAFGPFLSLTGIGYLCYRGLT